MSLVLTVDLNAAGALAGIASYQACLKDRPALHRNMAEGVEVEVSDHLRGLNSRSPNTSFYGRAARSTQVTSDGERGLVSITHRGLALRYYGGRVLPVNVKNLALPSDDVPYAGTEGRRPPREMGVLAYIPKRNLDVSGTTGYLVEGEEITIKRGPNKGKTRIAPKKGGKLLFTLRAWTDHEADPSVLPTVADLLQAATSAAADYIDAVTGGQGGAA